ncbi:MAG TPA: 16S rRNA (cytidine(1402)-2'-O)-methyltransferase [Syntrophales bacterium]|nr:16S rRNA (cytidine(1402)-2'-O)-methyltransferase [Syntrophales bacterium]HOX94306.1 16S rRNA (cytidine(1402)-2'-O)-methyltransferase [Syntrophales bacterium]HPI58388.1 16S rRNA (cytidine(1402)-2'-O)-methyltransferase [Syntrophales bacterium]HPN26062.1 16S rRNA (cytidine(1402)-2'-O)-methyltransferase [Syntrophales bacterium]HQM30399.1 16S rRNA (cytidine(1402)-2'-O)-methyltransferase [Syntrophales bacterium]
MVHRETAGRGTLFIVATPIGNLEDITLRALRVLKEVSLVAAEDTRRVRKLLQAYGIKTPVMSLYDQVESKKAPLLIARLREGKDVAYVCDAGTPLVSDPGYVLVRQAVEDGVPVVPVPGPSAVIAALSVAGLPTDRFVFCGFPPSKAARRRAFFKSLAGETGTLVFFESPRRLQACLEDLHALWGDRRAAVTRELTKKFETIYRGTLSELRLRLKPERVRGEITLLVEGSRSGIPEAAPVDLRGRIRKLRENPSLTNRDIVAILVSETRLPRREIYREVLQKQPPDRRGILSEKA